MLVPMLAAALLSTQALARTSASDIAYLPVAGAGDEVLAVVEELIEAREPDAARFRRSSAAPQALQPCLSEPLTDHVNRCIRRLLAPRDRNSPLVALVINVSSVSNVSGSVTFNRFELYCIGHRSIARTPLGDRLDRRRPAPQVLDRRRGAISDCLSEAAAIAPLPDLQFEDGPAGPRWRLRWGRPADDEGMARGSSAEHATVRIESRPTDCRLTARVVEIPRGERLRAGDRIELVQACPAGSVLERSLAAALGALRTGDTARFYIGYDGGLRYLAR